MGKMTKQAMIKKEQEEVSKQSGTIMGKPVQAMLDNMYPFGYDDSNTSSEVSSAIKPYGESIGNAVGSVLGKDAGNAVSSFINEKADAIGQGAGFFSKVYKGITGTDKAGNAAREFADLDLSKPEDRKRANELYAIMVKEEPRWGLRGGNIDRIQYAIRGRMDQNAIHAGQP